MSNEIPCLSLHDFLSFPKHPGAKSVIYEDLCIFSNLHRYVEHDVKRLPLIKPHRLDVYILILSRQGQLEFICDEEHYIMEPYQIFLCKPGSVLQFIRSDKEVSFDVIVCDHHFLELVNPSVQKLFPYSAQLGPVRCVPIPQREGKNLGSLLQVVFSTIEHGSTSFFYHESVRSLILSIVYMLTDCMATYAGIQADAARDINVGRKEDYYKRFTSLVCEHFRQERSVSFYADLLHISPKYLSTLVRQVSGRSATEVIDDCVMVEARNLLRNTDLSIQEIALQLNFSSQSFFGRYFRQHASMSPGQYRNS